MSDNMTSAVDNREYKLAYGSSLVCAVFVTIVGITSTIGNGTILLLFTRARYLFKSTRNLLVFNLAIADFGISLCGYPYIAASSYAGRWLFGHVMCNIYAFCTFWVSMVSYYMLAAIAVYRYIFLCHPFYRRYLTTRNTLAVIAVSWIYGMTWPLMPFLGWGDYDKETFGTSCTLAWTKQDLGNISMNISSTVFCFIAPLAVMIGCYIQIFRKLYTKPSDSDNSQERPSSNGDYQRRLAILSTLMASGFVITWGPYAVISITSSFYQLPLEATLIPTMFAKCAPCLNFMLYSACNEQFRHALRDHFCQKSIRTGHHGKGAEQVITFNYDHGFETVC